MLHGCSQKDISSKDFEKFTKKSIWSCTPSVEFWQKNYSVVDVFVRIFENIQTNDFS